MRTTATFRVSFADEDGCAGVAIIDLVTDDVKDIVRETIVRGCNPGPDYEVQVSRVPTEEIPDSYKNRLLNKTEVELLNAGNASKPN